jgi:type IV secretory pathway VirB4 component
MATSSTTVIDAKGKKNPGIGTQVYLPVSEIHDDTLVLKNGGVRAILRTTSLNFNLKSEQEQNALTAGYQSFLNSLEFPIQVVIRSRKLDIDKYIESLKAKVPQQKNPLLQNQTTQYIDFVSRLVEYADIMEKDFLVVVPFDPLRAQGGGIMEKFFGIKFLDLFRGKDSTGAIKQRREEFENLKKGLSQRVNIIQTGLENLGLKAHQLTTQELIELMYNSYNPVTSRNEKLGNVEKHNLEG